MARYKPEQGRMARMAVFWSLAVLMFYGCTSLNDTLRGQSEGLKKSMGSVPVLGIDLTPAFLISAVVFLACAFLLYRWSERPKIADALIDTESELHKVTWPTFPEVIDSSVVVVVCVLVLMGFLAFADWFLSRVSQTLLGI